MPTGKIENRNLENLMRPVMSRELLMKPELVVATIWGLKTETRRRIRNGVLPLPSLCPYGVPGDHLWIREPVKLVNAGQGWYDVAYRSAGSPTHRFEGNPHPVLKKTAWTPSIHMPRAVSRLTLRVEKVTVPKLQSITEEQARAEGYDHFARFMDLDGARKWFRLIWDEINEGKGIGWDENPNVWRIQFTVHSALK